MLFFCVAVVCFLFGLIAGLNLGNRIFNEIDCYGKGYRQGILDTLDSLKRLK